MAVTNVGSRWRHGFLEFFDTVTNRVIDAKAPVTKFDDFLGLAIDSTNDWNVAAVNGGTATADAGWMILTSGAANDDNVEVASELTFNGTNSIVFEARLRNDDVANSAVCVGLVDAITYGADQLAISYAGDTLVTNASDGACFFHDTDTTTDTWRAVCVDSDTNGAILDTTVTPVNSQIQNFRIRINASGFCDFWFSTGTAALEHLGEDILIGVTPGTSLCAYVGYMTRETAANTCDVDFMRVWGGKID